jgi:hypothetical protein
VEDEVELANVLEAFVQGLDKHLDLEEERIKKTLLYCYYFLQLNECFR